MATVAIDIRVIGNKRTGDETVFFELTKKLVAEHREHQYILLTNKTEKELAEAMTRLGVTEEMTWVRIENFGPQNRFWWNAVTLPLFLRKRKDIDVLHTQYILPFWLPKKLTVAAHIHDISFARYPKLIGRKDRFFLWLLIPRTLRRAHIITPSEFTKQEITEVYAVPPERITVIHNALADDFQQLLVKDECVIGETKKRCGLPKVYWLYVGTLQPRKNIPFLLETFAAVRASHPEVKLVLVGRRDGHHFDTRIDEVITRLGLQSSVIFPGYIAAEDLPLIYAGAELFAFPSLYEGFGLPLLEALSQGVRVVASDTLVHREVGGECVTYFPLDNVAKTAEILYSTSVAPKRAEEHVKACIKRFSWSLSATKLAKEYSWLAGENKR
jgi:glycosyltransferase involved in cell wall biosynthesis